MWPLRAASARRRPCATTFAWAWAPARPLTALGSQVPELDAQQAIWKPSTLQWVVLGSSARAPTTAYCASVSPSVRYVSVIVRQTHASVSANVRRKRRSVARRGVHHCAPLHLSAPLQGGICFLRHLLPTSPSA